MNEALLEQVLDSAPAGAPTTGLVPGDLSAEERAELLAAAAFEAEDADSPAEDGREGQRRDAYEQKLAELKKTPLRTVAPQIPPIPGKTYVNPWE